ncbi:hypothetical protein [Modestobacter lacusdianchii]
MVELYEGVFDAPKGELPLPEPGERFVGHHMLSPLAWTEGAAALTYVSSWGPAWGDQGFGQIDRNYFERYVSEAWVLRVGDYGYDLPRDFELFDPKLEDTAFKRAWKHLPAGQSVDIGEGRVLRWYTAPSLSGSTWTLVADVIDHSRVRLGWCHLEIGRYDEGLLADITELYVWPAFRRLGVGSELSSWARGQAEAADCEWFRILVYNADLDSDHAVPRQQMAQGRGLEWIYPSVAGMMGVGAVAGEWLRPPAVSTRP